MATNTLGVIWPKQSSTRRTPKSGEAEAQIGLSATLASITTGLA